MFRAAARSVHGVIRIVYLLGDSPIAHESSILFSRRLFADTILCAADAP